jgi:hypothetical protein
MPEAPFVAISARVLHRFGCVRALQRAVVEDCALAQVRTRQSVGYWESCAQWYVSGILWCHISSSSAPFWLREGSLERCRRPPYASTSENTSISPVLAKLCSPSAVSLQVPHRLTRGVVRQRERVDDVVRTSPDACQSTMPSLNYRCKGYHRHPCSCNSASTAPFGTR